LYTDIGTLIVKQELSIDGEAAWVDISGYIQCRVRDPRTRQYIDAAAGLELLTAVDLDSDKDIVDA